MGLDVCAKDMPRFKLSYSTYYRMRLLIIEQAYGEKCVEIFKKEKPSDEDFQYWKSMCNDDLDLFLLHSDCDGKFTPKECKRILKALEKIYIDMDGWSFDRNESINMLEQWKLMFEHCVKRRVCMFYY